MTPPVARPYRYLASYSLARNCTGYKLQSLLDITERACGELLQTYAVKATQALLLGLSFATAIGCRGPLQRISPIVQRQSDQRRALIIIGDALIQHWSSIGKIDDFSTNTLPQWLENKMRAGKARLVEEALQSTVREKIIYAVPKDVIGSSISLLESNRIILRTISLPPELKRLAFTWDGKVVLFP